MLLKLQILGNDPPKQLKANSRSKKKNLNLKQHSKCAMQDMEFEDDRAEAKSAIVRGTSTLSSAVQLRELGARRGVEKEAKQLLQQVI